MKKLLFLMLTFTSILFARDVIEQSGECQINWTQGYITCTADSESGQSRFAAKISAKVIAQRNLLEVIKGVKIDSVTTVKDGLLSSDVIQARVQGVIRGAEIVSNEYNTQEKYATAKARIIMGKDLLEALLSDPTKLSWNEKIQDFFANFSLITEAQASTYTLQDLNTLKKLREDLKEQGNNDAVAYLNQTLDQIGTKTYTGILINVSEVNAFEKAMIVKLVDKNGNEIYPAKKVSKAILTKKNTSVGYMFGFDDARNDKRIFNTPLEFKVTNVYHNRHSDIVLTDEQIEQIKQLHPEVLQKAKVILVLGD